MNLRRLLLPTASLLLLSACCGDLAQTPQVRRDFVQRFNADDALKACTLEAAGADLDQLTLTCAEHDRAWMEQRLKPVCSSFEPFNFASLQATGTDGRFQVALNAGCTFDGIKEATP